MKTSTQGWLGFGAIALGFAAFVLGFAWLTNYGSLKRLTDLAGPTEQQKAEKGPEPAHDHGQPGTCAAPDGLGVTWTSQFEGWNAPVCACTPTPMASAFCVFTRNDNDTRASIAVDRQADDGDWVSMLIAEPGVYHGVNSIESYGTDGLKVIRTVTRASASTRYGTGIVRIHGEWDIAVEAKGLELFEDFRQHVKLLK